MITDTSYSNRGFTLVEVLAAVIVMMIGLLGLLQVINVAIGHDMRNKLRDEAVAIGEQYMYETRLLPFNDISTTSPKLPNVHRNIKGVIKDFQVSRDVTALSAKTKRVGIRVLWYYKNFSSAHNVSAVVHSE